MHKEAYVIYGIGCFVALYVIYHFSMRYLPKTAALSVEYFRWLAKMLCRSAAVVFRQPWIWGPALAFVVMNTVHWAYQTRHILTWMREQPSAFRQDWSVWAPRLGDWGIIFCRRIEKVGVHTVPGVSLSFVVFYFICILLSVYVGRLLKTQTSLSPTAGRRWHLAFIVGACMGCLKEGCSILCTENRAVLKYCILARPALVLIMAPITALILALYLTIMIRSVRRDKLALGDVVKSAVGAAGPLAVLLSIAPILCVMEEGVAAALSLAQHGDFTATDSWLLKFTHLPDRFRLYSILTALTAFVPVVIVIEQCGLLQGFSRLGKFLWRNLWRYATMVAFGALFLTAGWYLGGFAQGACAASGIVAVYVTGNLISGAISTATGVTVSVMCLTFYLADAGNTEITSAEQAELPTPALPEEPPLP